MPAQKTTTLNLRVDPAIKEAVREAALAGEPLHRQHDRGIDPPAL